MFNGKEQENYQLLGRRLEVNFPILSGNRVISQDGSRVPVPFIRRATLQY